MQSLGSSALFCVRAFALIGIGSVSACTILYGPSSDEFSSGTKDGGGSSSASSAGGTSGAPSEGGASSSGTASSSSSGGGDSPAFACPNAPLICDDFESGKADHPPFVSKGTDVKTVAGGQGSANAVAMSFKDGHASYLAATLGAQPHVELSFWFRVDGAPNADPTIHFRIADLLFGDPCDWQLSWQVWIQTDGLHEGVDSYDAVVNPSCGPVKYTGNLVMTAGELFDGKWHHLTVDADSTATVRKTVVTIDTLPVVPQDVESTKSTPSSSLEVDLGMPCVQSGEGCFDWQGAPYTVYFDQVVVTAQ